MQLQIWTAETKLGKKRNIYNIYLEVKTKWSYTHFDSRKRVIYCSILGQSDNYTQKKLSKHWNEQNK